MNRYEVRIALRGQCQGYYYRVLAENSIKAAAEAGNRHLEKYPSDYTSSLDIQVWAYTLPEDDR